jgi:rare lipoprotein A
VRWLTLILLLCPTIAHACATATVYAARYDGRTTASGAVYRHSGISAASPWLRLGTRVVVTHGDRTISLVITDTMPVRYPRDGRCVVLDLSGAAARRLGIGHIAFVKIKVLQNG